MILTVYNTCGINGDKTDWYSECIDTLLEQDYPQQVVVSSCLNSDGCIASLKSRYGDVVKICRFSDRYIVNVTFNKAVQAFDTGHVAQFFVDSGVKLKDKTSLSQMAERLSEASMVSLQTDTDTGYEVFGGKQNSHNVQIKGQDFKLPLGMAINLHAQLFHRSIFDKFGLVIPDVFAAYCTESTFPFLNAAVGMNWVIVKDIQAHHNKAVDGPSSSQPHWSPVHKNPWNNLLYGRDARVFINDPRAIAAGLGYEECGKIMPHSEEAYFNEKAKFPEDLTEMIRRYYFSNREELDYDRISVEVL